MSERVCVFVEFVGGGELQDDGSVRASAKARRVVLGGDVGLPSGELAKKVERLEPASVVLETVVKREASNPGHFSESGEIVVGDLGRIKMVSAHDGLDGPATAPGEVGGAVIFRITDGTGDLAGAMGFVTANFVVTADGVLYDASVAMIETPS